jgi:hypothetical protein
VLPIVITVIALQEVVVVCTRESAKVVNVFQMTHFTIFFIADALLLLPSSTDDCNNCFIVN